MRMLTAILMAVVLCSFAQASDGVQVSFTKVASDGSEEMVNELLFGERVSMWVGISSEVGTPLKARVYIPFAGEMESGYFEVEGNPSTFKVVEGIVPSELGKQKYGVTLLDTEGNLAGYDFGEIEVVGMMSVVESNPTWLLPSSSQEIATLSNNKQGSIYQVYLRNKGMGNLANIADKVSLVDPLGNILAEEIVYSNEVILEINEGRGYTFGSDRAGELYLKIQSHGYGPDQVGEAGDSYQLEISVDDEVIGSTAEFGYLPAKVTSVGMLSSYGGYSIPEYLINGEQIVGILAISADGAVTGSDGNKLGVDLTELAITSRFIASRLNLEDLTLERIGGVSGTLYPNQPVGDSTSFVVEGYADAFIETGSTGYYIIRATVSGLDGSGGFLQVKFDGIDTGALKYKVDGNYIDSPRTGMVSADGTVISEME